MNDSKLRKQYNKTLYKEQQMNVSKNQTEQRARNYNPCYIL